MTIGMIPEQTGHGRGVSVLDHSRTSDGSPVYVET